MSMLQYRHKSRAWLQMVTADDEGNFRAIKDIIAQGIAEGEEGAFDKRRRPGGAAGAAEPDPGPPGAAHRGHARRRHAARRTWSRSAARCCTPCWSAVRGTPRASAARRSRSTGSSRSRGRGSQLAHRGQHQKLAHQGRRAQALRTRRLKQRALALDAAHGVVVEHHAADAAVLGQRARLELDRLRGEHARAPATAAGPGSAAPGTW